jgi:hypothetical protein
LKDHYCGSGKAISFDRLREETYSLPFIETHYRSVLKELEKEKCLVINRVQSIRTGISGRDMIQF